MISLKVSFFLCDFRFLNFFNLSSVWFPRKFLNGCIRPNLVEDKEMLEEKRIFSLFLKFFFLSNQTHYLRFGIENIETVYCDCIA